jgi:hypothetical protein
MREASVLDRKVQLLRATLDRVNKRNASLRATLGLAAREPVALGGAANAEDELRALREAIAAAERESVELSKKLRAGVERQIAEAEEELGRS